MSRSQLQRLSTQLDRLLAEADSILTELVYADIGTLADELRELVVEMQAKVEEKLDETEQTRAFSDLGPPETTRSCAARIILCSCLPA